MHLKTIFQADKLYYPQFISASDEAMAVTFTDEV
jgi:hypothetical protein